MADRKRPEAPPSQPAQARQNVAESLALLERWVSHAWPERPVAATEAGACFRRVCMILHGAKR